MKKEEVYVEVRTEKQARKLKKVLDMFNEPVFEDTDERLSLGVVDYIFPTVNFHNREWTGNSNKNITNKTKVSIKQLRNILAFNNLKEGDIVVVRCSISRNEYIVKVGLKIISDDLKICLIESPFYVCGEVCELGNESGVYGDFLRYATEEEKSLFDVKETPEQKVVKYAESVDWDFEKVFESINNRVGSFINCKEWRCLEGYESSDKVRNIFNKHNPHWELKKAFDNGEEVQYLSKLSNGWITDPTPSWNPLYEYRIRPLCVGDFVSYKSGAIRKITEITESNLAHFQKREGKRITDKAVIEYLNSI